MEQKFSNIYFNIKTIINFSNNDHIKKLAWINENNNFPIFFPRNIPIELKKRKISRVPKTRSSKRVTQFQQIPNKWSRSRSFPSPKEEIIFLFIYLGRSVG